MVWLQFLFLCILIVLFWLLIEFFDEKKTANKLILGIVLFTLLTIEISLGNFFVNKTFVFWENTPTVCDSAPPPDNPLDK